LTVLGGVLVLANFAPRYFLHAAFAAFERERPDALFVSIGTLFTARRVQLATLAVRHMIPMTSGSRQITETGGLMSYGANIADVYRQLGVYAGRILKGEKPADLPVVQSTTATTNFMGISWCQPETPQLAPRPGRRRGPPLGACRGILRRGERVLALPCGASEWHSQNQSGLIHTGRSPKPRSSSSA
jgi:hypothetical protein